MSALLLWACDRLYWFSSEGAAPEEVKIGRTPEEATRNLLDPPLLREWAMFAERTASLRGRTVLAGDSLSLKLLEGAGLHASLGDVRSIRAMRERLPPATWTSGRALTLLLASSTLERRLGSLEETVISLAREEERVERSVVRETGAADQWVSGQAGPLQTYEEDWSAHRKELAAFHGRLRELLEREARKIAPNLSALVGPRIAARLIALAGGLEPLGRMPAGRLQLLGARRRPGTGRNPRFGVIVRAEGMGSVPPDRQGAYARTLAAMAVVAARADSVTRRDVTGLLLSRKNLRAQFLQRKRTR